ncbi:MAG: hypothetical protein HYZ42_03665 [Bacteroidetes bacterium]|nr:hypothetical protein [Bacteroidota bacterium]
MTKWNGKTYIYDGKFSVLPLQVELSNTVADHHLLSLLSNNTNGALFFPSQLDNLYQSIKKNEEIKPISYSDRETNDLIKYKWLFFVLLTSLAIEWFVRTNQGSI